MLVHVLQYQCGKAVHLKENISSSNRKIYILTSDAEYETVQKK